LKIDRKTISFPFILIKLSENYKIYYSAIDKIPSQALCHTVTPDFTACVRAGKRGKTSAENLDTSSTSLTAVAAVWRLF